jgi:hypothetical protein
MTLCFKGLVGLKYRIKADYDSYRDKTWIHYSKHEEMKFNYKASHQDPIGIYFFPEGFKTAGSWHTNMYKYTANLKPDAKVLDLAKMNTKEKALELIDKLGARPVSSDSVFQDEHASKYKNYYIDRAWEWLTNHYTGRKAAFTKKLLNTGYDAIFDDTDSIFSGETQLIVLNPKMLTNIKQTRQGETGYKEVVKARDTILAALKGYEGKVLHAERPKRKKGFGRDPDYIESTIKFAHEEYTKSYEDFEGKTKSYPDYKRSILFTIRTGTESYGSGKKRPATKMEIQAEGNSDEYKKHFPNSYGDGYRPNGLSWRLEGFDEKEIVPWLHKVIKMLWDDEEPKKEKIKWDEYLAKLESK